MRKRKCGRERVRLLHRSDRLTRRRIRDCLERSPPYLLFACFPITQPRRAVRFLENIFEYSARRESAGQQRALDSYDQRRAAVSASLFHRTVSRDICEISPRTRNSIISQGPPLNHTARGKHRKGILGVRLHVAHAVITVDKDEIYLSAERLKSTNSKIVRAPRNLIKETITVSSTITPDDGLMSYTG
jgi:hypothetical protein